MVAAGNIYEWDSEYTVRFIDSSATYDQGVSSDNSYEV